MKKYILTPALTALLLLFTFLTAISADTNQAEEVKLICSDHYSAICNDWVSQYQQQHPDLKITLLTEHNYKEKSNFPNNALIVFTDEEISFSGWKTSVGKNVIVPFISQSNPLIGDINKKGISKKSIASGNEIVTWGELTGTENREPVHFYISDQELTKMNAEMLLHNKNISFIVVKDAMELASAVSKDPYAIGFCFLNEIAKNNSIPSGVAFLPFDKNGNGNLDAFENIYRDPETLLNGVWTGKYPSELVSNIYIASSGKPENKEQIDFVTWLLSSGQDMVSARGYANLGTNERNAKIDLLNADANLITAKKADGNYIWLTIFALAFFAAIILAVAFRRRGSFTSPEAAMTANNRLNENSILAPGGLYFDRTHTWAFMERDGLVRIGLDDFMHRITGTLTRVSMKEPGEHVTKGEKLFTIVQDGKQLSIHSPVSGIIRKNNSRLTSEASLINNSPYDEGWIYMIEPLNWMRESSILFMSDKYSEWIKNEFTRIKDFFAASAASHKNEYAHVVLQDGGELRENVLKELGPDVWEDFQSIFIDSSI